MTKKEIIFTLTKKDFEVQTFRAGGKGGQHQNKRDTGVRIIHRPSGAVGESRSERSQHQNKKLAFQRLANNKKLKVWINKTVFELSEGKSIEEKVEESMEAEHLKIEIKDLKGRWKISNEEWRS